MYPPLRYMGVSVYGRRVIPIEALVKGRTRRTAPLHSGALLYLCSV